LRTAKKIRLKGRDKFEQAFNICCAISLKKEELTRASDKASLESQIRGLEAKITPPNKQVALADRRPIVAKCLEYIRAHGAPTNHTHFIEWLRSEGVLTRTRFGKKYPISHTTARNILREHFGIVSRKGRKPGTSK